MLLTSGRAQAKFTETFKAPDGHANRKIKNHSMSDIIKLISICED
jgi:hypothetical protein